jgi:hypothetical protein
LDVEYRKQRNQQLQLNNDREQMLLEERRGGLIEKKVGTLRAATC